MPKIHELIAQREGKPGFSFEFFPPKTPSGVDNLYERAQRMGKMEPLFVDVTWGAGGSTMDLSLELGQNFTKFGLNTQLHLTCANMSKEQLSEVLNKAKEFGIDNILALRGDLPAGQERWDKEDGYFTNAVELVRFIRQEHGDHFSITVAGYPEGHIDHWEDDPRISPEAYKKDLQFLKEKVEAGANTIITQLFYDVNIFFKFVDDCRELGITVPIIPGIMPIQTYAGFTKMTGFSKTIVPKELKEGLEAVKHSDEEVKRYGVQVLAEMCEKLLERKVPVLHMYTLNLEKAAIEILSKLNLIADSPSQGS